MLRLIANTFYAGYKVPQVYNIYKTKSVAGLSIVSVCMELVSLMFATAYHFRTQHSLIAFADCVSFLVCNILILIQFKLYANSDNEKSNNTSKSLLNALLFASSWVLGVVFLCQATSLIPMIWINILKAITSPLMVVSQIPQIMTIFMQNSTGVVSTSSVMLHFLAATVLAFGKRPADPVIALGYHVAFALDLVLIFQIMLFNSRQTPTTTTPLVKPALKIQTEPAPIVTQQLPTLSLVGSSVVEREAGETSIPCAKVREADQLAVLDGAKKEQWEEDEEECLSPM